MKSRIIKRSLAVLLTLCMMFSMIAVGTVGTSAGLAGAVVEYGIEKVLDTGMRAASWVLDEVTDATGNEGFNQTFSFINNILFKDAAEVAIEKVAEMCQEILDELDDISEDLKEGFNIIDQTLASDDIRTAKTNLDKAWEDDVTDIFTYSGYGQSASISGTP